MQKAASYAGRILPGLFLLANLFLSCRRSPVGDVQQVTNALVGAWQKISPAPCSQGYPNVIEFTANGVYQTQSEETAVPQVWDTGTYEVDRQLVKIANAREVARTYRFVIKNEMVTFEDDQGCKFPYRRL
ncbi:hypothetical protein [Larkinella insperata]|nr:hypothetical protein [Larkinella insperata]